MEELYKEWMQIVDQQLEKNTPLELAAVLVAQGMALYKTVLPEDDYDDMIELIANNKDQIKPFDITNSNAKKMH
jgi:hypothetical protein